jgi:NAD(P)-dependent dehydrogenase (short-subunit alcohol dehydrogenase family)
MSQGQFPSQQQPRPGHESEMQPRPATQASGYRGSGKLQGKVALVTGADSGIGHAVAVAFAREGADVAIVYLESHEDAQKVKQEVEQQGRRAITIAGDIGDERFCQQAVQQTVDALGQLDILVNNAGEQQVQTSLEDISAEQLERTFRTNIFSQFFLCKAALPYLRQGSAIINTTSVNAYKGNAMLMDYSATKGAIVSFTRSLSEAVVEKGIRVNAVAPGPIWTPLIPSTMPPEQVKQFGSGVPMKRAAQPDEIAPCYVFLASSDSSYISGQTLHPNGGTIVGS